MLEVIYKKTEALVMLVALDWSLPRLNANHRVLFFTFLSYYFY